MLRGSLGRLKLLGPKTHSAVMERQQSHRGRACSGNSCRECPYPEKQSHPDSVYTQGNSHTAQHMHTQAYSYTQRVSTPKETVIHRSADNQRNSHVESMRISRDVIKEHMQTQGNSHTLRALHPDVHTETQACFPTRKERTLTEQSRCVPSCPPNTRGDRSPEW